jgi:Fe2+ or Zn2+ uptake regulation protein
VDANSADSGLLQSRYRLTKQRSAVMRALGTREHLTAETILERVRDDMPGVSLGTIYRTLDILREIGLVQVFSFAGSAARYEAALDKHHHLLCLTCRKLVDVRTARVGELARAIAEREGFEDVDFSLTIAGRCADCSAAAKAATVHVT